MLGNTPNHLTTVPLHRPYLMVAFFKTADITHETKRICICCNNISQHLVEMESCVHNRCPAVCFRRTEVRRGLNKLLFSAHWKQPKPNERVTSKQLFPQAAELKRGATSGLSLSTKSSITSQYRPLSLFLLVKGGDHSSMPQPYFLGVTKH